MTFWSANCATSDCPRQFTDEHEVRSRIWWRGMEGEPPVAFADFHRDCADYTPED